MAAVSPPQSFSTSLFPGVSPWKALPSFGALIMLSRAIDLLLLGVVVASNTINLWVGSQSPIWLLKFFYKFIVLNSHCQKDLMCFLFSWQEVIRFRQSFLWPENSLLKWGAIICGRVCLAVPWILSLPSQTLSWTLLPSHTRGCWQMEHGQKTCLAFLGLMHKNLPSLSSHFCRLDVNIQGDSGSGEQRGQGLHWLRADCRPGADPFLADNCQVAVGWTGDEWEVKFYEW